MDQKQGKVMLADFINRAYGALVIRIRKEETGATAVEYGVIVSLIAVIVIGAVATFGGTLSGMVTEIYTELTK